MSIKRAELTNLDMTLAAYIAPRLRAFAQATDGYPDDLPDIREWHAELTRMADAFDAIGKGNHDPDHETALQLFARRLGHLWL
jgi:hypothetical protein